MMVYIENEGALFRGPSRGNPLEVWSPRAGAFKPYADAGKPKPIEWGHVITDEEAKNLMVGDGQQGGASKASDDPASRQG